VTFDVLIRGGRLFDGLGREPIEADVAVRGDSVVAIGHALGGEAREVIDASGLAVAPGFVDVHAHGDLTPLMCPESSSRLHDGVTTELVGNCGASAFPQTDQMAAHSAARAARRGIPGEWRTVDDFAAAHETVGTAINRGTLIGHSSLREVVVGEVDRAPTEDEMAVMCHEVELAMDMGAFGMSSGLIYAPGMYARPKEIAALAAVAARYGGIYTSHIRSESGAVEDAVDEFIGVGRATGIRLQHSHVKVSGEANWGKLESVLERIERARADGVDLACDRYPYTASSTGLAALLPGWAREGGRQELVKRLGDADARKRMLKDMGAGRALDTKWQGVMIANAHADAWRHIEGRTVGDLAEEAGQDAAEMALDILRKTDGSASVVCFSMNEDNLVRWLSLPFVAIGSDGTTRGAEGPTAVGKPHPRSFGTWSRFLGRYVREKKVMPLREGIRRITSLPASRMGLTRRGVLTEGAFADVTVFDPETIEDRATYQAPLQYSVGVRHVLVNGQAAVRDGKLTPARAGRFLRRGES